jgi:hypothetical protein
MAKCQATTIKHLKLSTRFYKGKSNAHFKTQALKAGNVMVCDSVLYALGSCDLTVM